MYDTLSTAMAGGTATLASDIDCTQCYKNNQNTQNVMTQPGRFDMTREVFPWLEIAIGKSRISTDCDQPIYSTSDQHFTDRNVCSQAIAQEILR